MPPVIAPTSSQTVDDGETVFLVCSVTGNPEPSLGWFYEGTAVAELGIKRVRVVNGRLKIRTIKLSDAGTYSCVASNEVATARREIEVTVRSKVDTGLYWFSCL